LLLVLFFVFCFFFKGAGLLFDPVLKTHAVLDEIVVLRKNVGILRWHGSFAAIDVTEAQNTFVIGENCKIISETAVLVGEAV
jgi:hypothetical protein